MAVRTNPMNQVIDRVEEFFLSLLIVGVERLRRMKVRLRPSQPISQRRRYRRVPKNVSKYSMQQASDTSTEVEAASSVFHLFKELPSELRLKIWRLTIPPRIVHYNFAGYQMSRLKACLELPIILQVCQESRSEILRVYQTNSITGHSFFNPEIDTLLWTRYPHCPNTMNEDVEILLDPLTLKNVSHFAILAKHWNMILSRSDGKKVYATVRNALTLEVLTIVDDILLRRHTSSHHTAGRFMSLVENCPGKEGMRFMKWERDVKQMGKERVWEKWDAAVMNPEWLVRRELPEIRFASVVLN